MKNSLYFIAGVAITLICPWNIHELVRAKAMQLVSRVVARTSHPGQPVGTVTAAATETPLPVAAETPSAEAKADDTADTVKDEAKSGADKDDISPEDTKAILDAFNSGPADEK